MAVDSGQDDLFSQFIRSPSPDCLPADDVTAGDTDPPVIDIDELTSSASAIFGGTGASHHDLEPKKQPPAFTQKLRIRLRVEPPKTKIRLRVSAPKEVSQASDWVRRNAMVTGDNGRRRRRLHEGDRLVAIGLIAINSSVFVYIKEAS
jgi:hypothetical protein